MSALIIVALSLFGIVAWAACGGLAYGITVAYYQQHFYEVRSPKHWLAGYLALIGPMGLAISFVMSEFAYHGLQWHHETSEWILYDKITDQVRADNEAVQGHPRKVLVGSRDD